MDTHTRTEGPYRRDPDEAPEAPTRWAWLDADVYLGVVLFAASITRVVVAVVDRETFGAEATLALLVVIGLAAAGLRIFRTALRGR
jgi:hypothetical protein